MEFVAKRFVARWDIGWRHVGKQRDLHFRPMDEE
jgi:hypothetical protein